MKAVVAAFNQEKALVGAFSVITNLRMQLLEALQESQQPAGECGGLRLDLCPAHFLRWLVVVLLRYQWVPFMFSHQLLGARSGRSQGCGSWVTSPPTAATAKVHSFSLQTGNNE